jgi:hypothetical protein
LTADLVVAGFLSSFLLVAVASDVFDAVLALSHQLLVESEMDHLTAASDKQVRSILKRFLLLCR